MYTTALGIPEYRRDLSQSKSIIPSTRIASSLVIFAGDFDFVVACNIRRATTSPFSTRLYDQQPQPTERVNQLTNSTRQATTISLQVILTKILTEKHSDVPYYDPRYAFHRVVVQVIVYGIQLRGDVSTQE